MSHNRQGAGTFGFLSLATHVSVDPSYRLQCRKCEQLGRRKDPLGTSSCQGGRVGGRCLRAMQRKGIGKQGH